VIEPLRFSVEVRCAPARAFELWTAETTRWWPPSHTTTGHPPDRIVFEPEVGGGVYEVTAAGERVDWGRVLAWDPPNGLAYAWHLRQDRGDATEVHIAFVPLGGGGTRLEIEHRGWDRLGARGSEGRERNAQGWSGLLPHFVAECATAAAG
jgi:uncharacterized protein YndB with AHSA1/START domain